MLTRLMLLVLAGICVTMNVLVYRAEYSSKDNELPVPTSLVWRKIMTAPEASSLNVFQAGKRTGFCEFSTGVGQEMAQMDENRPPPEGFIAHNGYQIRINGNASLGDFTNRIKFDGRLLFTPARVWHSMNLRILMRSSTIEIDSIATNQTVHIAVTTDGEIFDRTLTYAELGDPNKLLRSVMGDLGGSFGGFLASMELPALSATQAGLAGGIQWEACRTRIMFGHEPVPVYRLETRILDHPVVIIVSTLGEIMRVDLPDDLVATLDEWGKP